MTNEVREINIYSLNDHFVALFNFAPFFCVSVLVDCSIAFCYLGHLPVLPIVSRLFAKTVPSVGMDSKYKDLQLKTKMSLSFHFRSV